MMIHHLYNEILKHPAGALKVFSIKKPSALIYKGKKKRISEEYKLTVNSFQTYSIIIFVNGTL